MPKGYCGLKGTGVTCSIGGEKDELWPKATLKGCFTQKFVLYDHWFIQTRGLHGLKTEARTRPVPEIVWPDPTRAAQLNLEPEPDPKSPPPPITNTKKREKDCISRLHAKKRINQGSAISQTFTSYESLWTSGAAVAYILPSLWILFGQEDDDRANYGHFCQLRLVSILSTLNQT